MIKIARILLVAVVLVSTLQSALADRGIGKKSKSKITLNISTPSILKNSISFNTRLGLRYSGSVLLNQQTSGNSMLSNSLLTYQKGNTVYIIPYKQKVIIPEIKPGYTGMKLIIRPH
ncbi:MAG: hypothetical protein WCI49_04280 [Ferruginibacter sp.]